VLTRLNPLTYAVPRCAPSSSPPSTCRRRLPAKFSSSVTLFGHTLSNAACTGITCAFAVAFLASAVTGFGKPD
jgi:hypothetical protein